MVKRIHRQLCEGPLFPARETSDVRHHASGRVRMLDGSSPGPHEAPVGLRDLRTDVLTLLAKVGLRVKRRELSTLALASVSGHHHRRPGRSAEDHQGQNSRGYVAPDPSPASTQAHPGHPEPSSLLTELIDRLEAPIGAPERLFSVRKTAELLRVSGAAFYALVAGRKLRCVRVSNAIRVRAADLQAYISQP
jgi:excisionase family DNA binding protein